MIKFRWLKEYKGIKKGEVSMAGKKSAENFVSQGYAEYVNEPKEEENHIKIPELERLRK